MPNNSPVLASQDLMNLLKRYYKDGVQSDIYRNSPVLPMLDTFKWSGESLRWAATYAASPTASNDYTVTANMASKTGKNAQWESVPARHFAALTISDKEIFASRPTDGNNGGSFGRILGNKLFLALEGMRKQIACEFYGRGYGEFAVSTAASVVVAENAILPLPPSATIALVPGTQFRILDGGFGGTVVPAVGSNPFVVKTVGDDYITLTMQGSSTGTITVGDVLIFDGAVDAGGNYHAPDGLQAWLLDRDAVDYNARLAAPFNNVVRAVAPGPLGGQYTAAISGEKKFDVLQRLHRLCRRAGAAPNIIIMNDADAAAAIAEYEAVRTQFISAGERSADTLVGAKESRFVLWSNFIDHLVDDPFCPELKAFMITKEHCNIAHWNNIGKVIHDNAGPGEEPGRSDPLANDSANYGEQGDKLLIEDVVSIEDGERTADGAVKLVALNLFLNYCIWNSASSGLARLL